MENKTNYFIGIDVSKDWFDVSVMAVINYDKQPMVTDKFTNSQKGLSIFKEWLKTHKVSFSDQSLCVIENTGIYHRLIWQFFNELNIPINIGNAAHIKKSFGIVRGKNDKVDSQRLCSYAFKNADELKMAPTANPVFLSLKDLSTSRIRLKRQLTSNKAYLRELKKFNDKHTQQDLERMYKNANKGLEESIKRIEAEIKRVIKSDCSISKNYKLLMSIPGIGHITTVYILCCTQNFAGRISGKQLGCYAGVVPFSQTSGKSVVSRNKVHKMSNKELKSLLHLCALTTIKYYPEFRHYYDRKTGEGKHPNSVLNAICNKLLLRAASVVNNQRPYVCNFNKAA